MNPVSAPSPQDSTNTVRPKTRVEIWAALEILSDEELFQLAKAHRIHQRTFVFIRQHLETKVNILTSQLNWLGDYFKCSTQQLQVLPGFFILPDYSRELWNRVGFYKPSWDLTDPLSKKVLMVALQNAEAYAQVDRGGYSHLRPGQWDEERIGLGSVHDWSVKLEEMFPHQAVLPKKIAAA